MYRTFIILMILPFSTTVLAQTSFSPSSMQHSVVKVNTYNKEGQLRRKGAGVQYRRTRDSLYVLTAKHLIYGGVNTSAPSEITLSFLSGLSRSLSKDESVIYLLESIDIAVIGFKLQKDTNIKSYLRTLPTGHDYPRTGETVFALGCARNDCWHRPIRATIRNVGSKRLRFSAPILASGLSGGILVNDFGRALGVIINSSSGLGYAVPLSFITSGYNLVKENVSSRVTEVAPDKQDFSFNIDIIPFPPQTLGGSYLIPGFGFRGTLYSGNFYSLTPALFYRLSLGVGRTTRRGRSPYVFSTTDENSTSSAAMHSLYLSPRFMIGTQFGEYPGQVGIVLFGLSYDLQAQTKRYTIIETIPSTSTVGYSNTQVRATESVTYGGLLKFHATVKYPLLKCCSVDAGVRMRFSSRANTPSPIAQYESFRIEPFTLFFGMSLDLWTR